MGKLYLFLIFFVTVATTTFAQCGDTETFTVCDMTVVDGDSNGTPDGIINLYEEFSTLSGTTITAADGMWFDPNFNFALDVVTGDLYLWDLDSSSELDTDYQFEFLSGTSGCPEDVQYLFNIVLGPYSGTVANTMDGAINLQICQPAPPAECMQFTEIDLFQTMLSNPSPHSNGEWTYTGSSANFVSITGNRFLNVNIPYQEGPPLVDEETFELVYTVPGITPCDAEQSTTVTVSVVREPFAGFSNQFNICDTELIAGNYDGDIDLLVCGIDASLQGNTLIIRNNTSTPNTYPTKSTFRNTIVSGDTATMFWNRCTDNETPQMGLTYNVYVGNGISGSSYDESTLSSLSNVLPNFLSPVPFGYRRVARMGNALQDTSLTLFNLPPNTYYWSVQTIDNGYLGSNFAAVQVFNILPTSKFTPTTNTICLNDILTIQYSGTGDTSYTYHWDFNGGTVLTNHFDSTLTVMFPSGGMKQLSLYLSKNGANSDTTYFNVFVDTVDISVIQNGTTLTSNATGATYQWIDCGNGNDSIAGEINATYNAAAIGSYAVIVTEGSCSDTSACVAINCVPTSNSFNVTECISYTIPSGNNTITAIGTQTVIDTIANSCGLDSVMTISVTISPQLTGVHNETICFGDSVIVNGTTYNSTNLTGTEVFTVGANNCDSTVSVNLTVLPEIDTSITQNGATLISNIAGAVYQWIDCDNGNTSIAGQTSQSFTATTSGNYAVIVTENSCTDTSTCINVVVTGVDDINNRSNIKLYPNPTNNKVTLTLNETRRSISVVMRDVGGRSVLDKVFENKRNISLNLENLDAGIYFMNVTFDDETSVVKLIKD